MEEPSKKPKMQSEKFEMTLISDIYNAEIKFACKIRQTQRKANIRSVHAGRTPISAHTKYETAIKLALLVTRYERLANTFIIQISKWTRRTHRLGQAITMLSRMLHFLPHR